MVMVTTVGAVSGQAIVCKKEKWYDENGRDGQLSYSWAATADGGGGKPASAAGEPFSAFSEALAFALAASALIHALSTVSPRDALGCPRHVGFRCADHPQEWASCFLLLLATRTHCGNYL
jgi:hypothetical protein